MNYRRAFPLFRGATWPAAATRSVATAAPSSPAPVQILPVALAHSEASHTGLGELPERRMPGLSARWAAALGRAETHPCQRSGSSIPAATSTKLRRQFSLSASQLSVETGPEPSYQNVISGYKTFHYKQPFLLDYGGVLPDFQIAYETWGNLNDRKDNAILLHTGLSASSHAKSHSGNLNEGWWEKFIGPNAALDTSKFFVICTNVIGSCYGSTGPRSKNPRTTKPYGTDFPMISIWDIVRAQFHLLDRLGVDSLWASVGASMGGMQSLAAAILFPERVKKLITISGCARAHPYSIALRHAQRQVLMSDPNWNGGFYYEGTPPRAGMKLARQIATISYRSGPEWEERFGRKRVEEDCCPTLSSDFLIETYLDRQGARFSSQYDANSMLYISRAMDLFDTSHSAISSLISARSYRLREAAGLPGGLTEWAERSRWVAGCDAKGYPAALVPRKTDPAVVAARARKSGQTGGEFCAERSIEDLTRGLERVAMPTLVLGVQSDILFPCCQQREIANSLRKVGNESVTYYELDSKFGHDTFLIDVTSVGLAVKGHLEL